jgi:hypothetical protein
VKILLVNVRELDEMSAKSFVAEAMMVVKAALSK